MVSRLPQVSEPGFTWDGSPPAAIEILGFQESRPVLKVVGGGGQDSRRCMQKPMMEYTDESGLAVTQLQDRMFNESVEQVVNDGNTFGPYGPDGGATPLMSTALRYRAFAPPSTGPPVIKYPGFGNLAGHLISVFRSEMTIKKSVKIESLQVLYSSAGPAVPVAFLGVSASGSTQARGVVSLVMNQMGAIDASGFNFTTRIETGGWFAAWSNLTAQAVIYFNRAEPLLIQMRSGPQPMIHGATVVQISLANVINSTAAAGKQLVVELASIGTSLHTSITSLSDVVALIEYIAEPTGLRIARGTRQSGVENIGLLDVLPDPHNFIADVAVGTHHDPMMVCISLAGAEFRPLVHVFLSILVCSHLPADYNPAEHVQVLPLRVGGFVRRWTVGLWQVTGYVVGHYGSGKNRYSELGLDAHNFTHVPLYTGLADSTHVLVGHPVTAVGDGADQVVIQVTNVRLENGTSLFHVSVNNPTDVPITMVVSSQFEAVRLQTQRVDLEPGEDRTLQ